MTPHQQFPIAGVDAYWWLSTDTLANLPDGTRIASWPATLGNSPSASYTREEPTKQTVILNGVSFPVVRFDGMHNRLVAAGYTVTQPYTLYLLTSRGASSCQVALGATDDSQKIATKSDASAGFGLIPGPCDVHEDLPMPLSCFTVSCDGTRAYLYRDGWLVQSGLHDGAGFPGLVLGATASHELHLDGDMSDILLCAGCHSQRQIDRVVNYFATRRHMTLPYAPSGAKFAPPVGVGEILRFGAVSDLHYANRDAAINRYHRQAPARLAAAIDEWNADAFIEFILSNGDVIDGSGSGTDESDWATLRVEYAKSRHPYYFALGNHEHIRSNKTQALSYSGQGAGYYSFDTARCHVVVLDASYRSDDDNDPYGGNNFDFTVDWVPPAERRWLANDLARTSRPTVVFCHNWLHGYPARPGVKNSSAVRGLLEASGKVRLVVSGHSHLNNGGWINGIRYIALDALAETACETAYATCTLFDDGSVLVNGRGRQRCYAG